MTQGLPQVGARGLGLVYNGGALEERSGLGGLVHLLRCFDFIGEYLGRWELTLFEG